jgi:N-acyl-D-amino-acid deacylase
MKACLIHRSLLAWMLVAMAGHAADEATLREAVTRSLHLIESSAAIGIDERPNCFTCHHSGLPVMTLLTARERGFPVQAETLQAQLQFTADQLGKGRANYLLGKGQGGQAFMAGSALWTLKLGGWKPDATTGAVVEYLLGHQKELGHWKPPSIRPPSEESPFSATYFALESLKHFSTADQQTRSQERIAQAQTWLLQTPARTTEDRVFRLASLHVTNAEATTVQSAASELLRTQRPDGGWAQLESMSSDAYATGTALVHLQRTGSLLVTDPAYQRGLQWLLQDQLADGSWHIVSRSKPFQKYFESGYPHGKDQFISITAACWATTALALALPVSP